MFAADSHYLGLGLLLVASILLNMSFAANLVLGQRSIFTLDPETHSRLNGIYLALFFAGGALGSFLGVWVYASYGWNVTLWTGMAFSGAALLYWFSE
jgi:predicted MFS family arabinose efflux permease